MKILGIAVRVLSHRWMVKFTGLMTLLLLAWLLFDYVFVGAVVPQQKCVNVALLKSAVVTEPVVQAAAEPSETASQLTLAGLDDLVVQAEEKKTSIELAQEWAAQMTDEALLQCLQAVIREENPKLSEKKVDEFAQAYLVASKENGIPPTILLAITRQETHFRPDDVSKAGAVGPMQLMPKTGRWISKKEGVWKEPKAPVVSAKTPKSVQVAVRKEYRQKAKAAEKELRRIIKEPETNIQLCSRVLYYYLREADNDWEAALNRYSGGHDGYPQSVMSHHEDILDRVSSMS